MEAGELAVRISACAKEKKIEGVTFTGGEPLAQARALASLARALRAQGLTLVCYTGYEYSQILKGIPPHGLEAVLCADILIDGLYREEEKAPLLWRGSRNQKVHFLTERYASWRAEAEKKGRKSAEIQVSASGMAITGYFDQALWERLRKHKNTHDSQG